MGETFTPPHRNHASRWFPLLAFLLTGLAAGNQVASWPARLLYPGDANYGGDSMPLVETVHLRRGVPIYALYSRDRYDAANWGPLFYLLGSEVVDPDTPSYVPLRMLSMIGTLGSAVGCAFLAFWFARSYLAAALAPLLFLSQGFVTYYGISARGDSVALLLSFAGFLIVYRFRDTRRLLLAVPFILLGFFYKQQFVAGPVAVLLFLWLEKRYRLAGELAGLLAVGGAGSLLYFQFVAFSGQAFLHHFLFYNLLPFALESFAPQALFFCLVLFVPLLVGLQSLRVYPDRLLRCYLGSAVLLSLLTIGRIGSGKYYFYECFLVLCVLFAALLAKGVSDPARAAGFLFLLGICLLLAQFTPLPPRRMDFDLDRGVQDYLKRRYSPQTPALGYYSGDLMRAGLEVPISNIFHYTSLVRKGVFSERDLLVQIQNHRFGVIVLNFDLQTGEESIWTNMYLTAPMRQTIRDSYQLDATLEVPRPERVRAEDRFYVWIPRSM